MQLPSQIVREILKNIDYENGYSLYVGIPFCPSICLYCSFSSYPLERWRKYCGGVSGCAGKGNSGCFRDDEKPEAGYGLYRWGTPTTLEPDQLRRLLGAITEYFPCEELAEFTVEAGRPGQYNLGKADHDPKDFPITRISVNPQTMNQETLDIIGRRHTGRGDKEVSCWQEECGFDNINMDLIVGLPGEDRIKVAAHTLNEVEALNPDSA